MQPSLTPSTPLLFVASPQDAIGEQLAQALSDAGLEIVRADSPDSASRCADYPFCIIALAPATKDDPLITAALKPMRGRLIPLLLEAMPLPSGHWATAPVHQQSSLLATAQAVKKTIDALPPAPPPLGAKFVHYETPVGRLPSERYSRRRVTGSGIVSLAVIMAILLLVHSCIQGH